MGGKTKHFNLFVPALISIHRARRAHVNEFCCFFSSIMYKSSLFSLGFSFFIITNEWIFNSNKLVTRFDALLDPLAAADVVRCYYYYYSVFIYAFGMNTYKGNKIECAHYFLLVFCLLSFPKNGKINHNNNKATAIASESVIVHWRTNQIEPISVGASKTTKINENETTKQKTNRASRNPCITVNLASKRVLQRKEIRTATQSLQCIYNVQNERKLPTISKRLALLHSLILPLARTVSILYLYARFMCYKCVKWCAKSLLFILFCFFLFQVFGGGGVRWLWMTSFGVYKCVSVYMARAKLS